MKEIFGNGKKHKIGNGNTYGLGKSYGYGNSSGYGMTYGYIIGLIGTVSIGDGNSIETGFIYTDITDTLGNRGKR